MLCLSSHIDNIGCISIKICIMLQTLPGAEIFYGNVRKQNRVSAGLAHWADWHCVYSRVEPRDVTVRFDLVDHQVKWTRRKD